MADNNGNNNNYLSIAILIVVIIICFNQFLILHNTSKTDNHKNIPQIEQTAQPTSDNSAGDEMVAFNQKSFIYHDLSCEWAQRCTINCITIPRSEAIKRGGRPCKICGGGESDSDESYDIDKDSDDW